MKVHHPATFSDAILRHLANSSLLGPGVWLDPFAGVGKVHRLADAGRCFVGVEIEEVWAREHQGNLIADALHLPFRAGAFDGAVTSPCYGNRMADSHNAKDGSLRRSYTHDLQRTLGDTTVKLHPANSGVLYAWQSAYWRFHGSAWQEVHRVLRPGAQFFLNVSDCFRTVKRNGVSERRREYVVDTHLRLCLAVGFDLVGDHAIATPRMRYGENDHRVEAETVLEFRRP